MGMRALRSRMNLQLMAAARVFSRMCCWVCERENINGENENIVQTTHVIQESLSCSSCWAIACCALCFCFRDSSSWDYRLWISQTIFCTFTMLIWQYFSSGGNFPDEHKIKFLLSLKNKSCMSHAMEFFCNLWCWFTLGCRPRYRTAKKHYSLHEARGKFQGFK